MRQLVILIDVQAALHCLLDSAILLLKEKQDMQLCQTKHLQLQMMFIKLFDLSQHDLKSTMDTLQRSQDTIASTFIGHIYMMLTDTPILAENRQLLYAACVTFNNDGNDFKPQTCAYLIMYDWFNVINWQWTWHVFCTLNVSTQLMGTSTTATSTPGKV